jgi:predicted DNA binding CopG/RHH family protein
MHIQTLLELIQYRIHSADDYLWKCYGDKVKLMDFENEAGEEVGTALFSTVDKQVREIYVFNDEVAHRWIDPGYREAYLAECTQRKVNPEVFTETQGFTQVEDSEQILDLVAEFAVPGTVRIQLSEHEIEVLTQLAKDKNMDYQDFINQVATDYVTRLIEEHQARLK